MGSETLLYLITKDRLNRLTLARAKLLFQEFLRIIKRSEHEQFNAVQALQGILGKSTQSPGFFDRRLKVRLLVMKCSPQVCPPFEQGSV
jgi:hypothetical protein